MSSEIPTLHAGTARADITPPVGVHLTGYVARENVSIGIHDPLYARALVLDDGRSQAAVITCDLVGLNRSFVARARDEIGTATGIPAANIMITCTHTHSGPATFLLHECGDVDPTYLEALRPRLVEVARLAAGGRQPVEIGTGSGTFAEGLFNRRRDGGSIDAAVASACFRTHTGETIAVLVNYGCHPVVMDASNLLISADYPGAVTQALEAALGGIAFFFTGACGNIDPVRRGSFEDVRWLGEHLAEQVIDTVHTMRFGPAEPLHVAREVLALPLQPVLDTEALSRIRAENHGWLAEAACRAEEGSQTRDVPQAQEEVPMSVQVRIHRAMLAWAKATLAQVQTGTVPHTVEAEVQSMEIGPLVIAGVPGELFSNLGRQIKNGDPARQVFVAGYANDDVGYIPDAAAYAVGGYEVEEAYRYYNAPAALHPQAGAQIVAAAHRLMKR